MGQKGSCPTGHSRVEGHWRQARRGRGWYQEAGVPSSQCRRHMAVGGLGLGTCALETAVVRSWGNKHSDPSSMVLSAAEAGPMAVNPNNMFK